MNSVDIQSVPPVEPATTTPLVVAKRPTAVHLPSRRNNQILGLSWLHGALQVATFRRQVMGATWVSPEPVHTLEEFETALDTALIELKFAGSEVFLILEHEKFVHQAEHAPSFSDKAAKAYLHGRVQRHEKDHSPVLWVSQRTVSTRQESAFLLHMLPSDFYADLSALLLARRLDLTRILPLAVPLQLLLQRFPVPKDQPVLMAAEAGESTTVMLAGAEQQMYFARTMQARWESDPARISVELNRTLLYAKQQFGVVVANIWLLGEVSDQAKAEVQTRCGAEKSIIVRTVSPIDWLQAVAKLSARHPVNLVAGHLSRKRRIQFLRRAVLAACWLCLVLVGLDTWTGAQSWNEEKIQLAGLKANEDNLLTQRDRLTERNTEAEERRRFIKTVMEERLPPVPARFLAFVGGALPPEISLTSFNAKRDDGSASWSFRLEGQIAADEETSRELLNTFQKVLGKSPLRAHFYEGARAIVPVPVAGSEFPVAQRFSVEGGLLEN